MDERRQLKIALVGCGRIAGAHLKGVRAHAPQITVTAAVDIDRDRAVAIADETGAEPFTSLDDALRHGDFSAVDIMLPHHAHEDAAVRAFTAGKHVVLEKPMATTIEACDRILTAARDAGTTFMIAEQAQYWPDAIEVKRMIDDGIIGDVITARAYFGGAAGPGITGKPWRFDKSIAGGGICIDGGSHWIRPLRMWFGEIDEVVAVTGRPLAEMEGESLVHALMRFRSGLVVTYDALHAGAVIGAGEQFRVTGSLGEIVIERGRTGRVLLFDREHPDGVEIPVTVDGSVVSLGDGRSAAYGLQLSDFAHAVLDGTALAADAEHSLGEVRTALAVYRSAETRSWQKVWE
ncbi:MAG: gfo/Idh/MocA family oxidoreductase [Spirochaetaceae bacterium]|nr:MAG: gfo/Idh/MocA family oxidoreductase [Spirochaetaceae bacterium]